jgi:opacity protein-like surface antigen
MKKLLAIIICLGFVLCVTAAYAAPVGNIATPATLQKGIIYQDKDAQFAVVAGGEIDLIFDRKLKLVGSDYDVSSIKSKSNAYGGKVGILIMDRFMPYTVLGAAKHKIKVSDAGESVSLETKDDFIWAIGGTAMLYETKLEGMGNGTLRIGVDGRYRQFDTNIKKITVDGGTFKIDDKVEYKSQEWQVALALSYQIEQIIPYVGVKYSDVRTELKEKVTGDAYKVKLKAKNNVGIFVGGDIAVNDSFTANIEGRFIDETALSLGATVRF